MTQYDRVVRAGAYIQGARMAFTSNPPDKSKAMSLLGATYAELCFSIAANMEFLKVPLGVQLDRKEKELLNDANEALNFIALGVDMVEYHYVPKLFPHTSITMSGDYQSTHWRTYDDLDEKTFNLCDDFLETLRKKAEDLERKAGPLKELTERR